MNGSDPKQTARDLLVEAHPALIGLSHWIHANPELGYQEVLSSGWVADWMTTAGFEVRRNVAGMETALAASFGSGPFHVAVCAEYDALPAVGHACGHNVIAAAAVGAAIALASVADELGLRVTLFGTPAEEGGGGKLVLIEAGEFDTVHAALMVHPGPDDILEPEILGVRTLNIAYTGREAHAAGFPELGINALDALTVAQVAIGLLRQQLETGDRVHGIVTKGGDAPNIIPARTSATFMVRSRTRGGLDAITQRVTACFEAGALATGAALELTQEVAYSPMLHDPDLVALYRLNAEATGRWFDPLARMTVSTDMGDVSHVVPSIHPMIGIESRPFVNHQPEFAEASVAPAADQAIFDGALLLAWTVIDAATNDQVRERLTGSVWRPEAERARAGTTEGTWVAAESWRTSTLQDTHSRAGEWGTSGDVDASTSWAEPAPTAFELTLIETVAAEPVNAAEGRDAESENAAQVAWAADPPAAPAWDSESTADDVEPLASAADGAEADGTTAPSARDGARAWERDTVLPGSTADAAWTAAVETPFGAAAESEAWAAGETLTVEEAWPGAYGGSEQTGAAEATLDAEVDSVAAEAATAETTGPESDAEDASDPESSEPPSTDAGSDGEQGDDYAQWEADFAAALDSLDQGTGSLSAEGAAEDGSGEAIELETPADG